MLRDAFSTFVVKKLYDKMSVTFRAGEPSSGELDFSNRELALYIHFPFCDTICKYCPFSRSANHSSIDEYMNSMLAELELLHSSGKLINTTVSSLSFGGGTPSLIPADFLKKLLQRLSELLPNFDSIQKTMECTPESITEERLQLFHEVGITRLSIGVQSLQSTVLNELGRKSSPELIRGKLSMIQNSWSGSWSCDLIYGFESHTEEQFLKDIEELTSYSADHISMFPLVNSDKNNKQSLTVKQFRTMKSMHREATILLKAIGFNAYSIEDYSRSNSAELKYQKDVWSFPQKDMLILGTGAFGISNSTQYRKTNNRNEYIQQIRDGKFPVDRYLPIDPKREAVARPLMGLHYNSLPKQPQMTLFTILKVTRIVKFTKNEVKLTEDGRFITSLLWAKIMIDRMS